MAAILQDRLTNRLRSGEGLTYSPRAASSSSAVFLGASYAYAMIELPVDKVDQFFTELAHFTAALRDTPPTPDELERAKRPRITSRIRALRENGYWLSALDGRPGQVLRIDPPGAVLETGAVTASFGVASYQAGDGVDELVGRADAALYAAKTGGRNRVESARADAEPALATSL